METVLENATIFIKLMPNSGNVWPIFVENDSTHEVSMAQIVSIDTCLADLYLNISRILIN